MAPKAKKSTPQKQVEKDVKRAVKTQAPKGADPKVTVGKQPSDVVVRAPKPAAAPPRQGLKRSLAKFAAPPAPLKKK